MKRRWLANVVPAGHICTYPSIPIRVLPKNVEYGQRFARDQTMDTRPRSIAMWGQDGGSLIRRIRHITPRHIVLLN
ncbi:MAG: hypothetical protein ACYSR4_04700, partial [Planctomycetota bacterium]